MLNEFMGAIRMEGGKYLNYLLKAERESRIQDFSSRLGRNQVLGSSRCKIYLLGSYLRQKVYNDIDVIVVFKQGRFVTDIDNTLRIIADCFKDYSKKLDFTICSEEEFSQLTLTHDNRVQVL